MCSRLLLVPALLWLSSCATAPSIQPQINSLVVAGYLDEALHLLNTKQSKYGGNNRLLYLMDKGLILHYAGEYRESIHDFERVKKLLDELYTRSLSNIATTWIFNDYNAPYRGEDFEHVLVNIFQALNFAALGEFPEALVEARDVDQRLRMINALYPDSANNVYQEDAFARLLMGILYEATGGRQDFNDAYISYKQSLAAYESEFYQTAGTGPPEILIENLLAAAQHFDVEELKKFRKKFGIRNVPTREDKEKNAQIYVVEYNGLSPLKHPWAIPLPLPGPYITKLSFPQYDPRYYETRLSTVTAKNSEGKQFQAETELGENIETIAEAVLKSRRLRVYTKAIARPALKYAAERQIGKKIEDKHGDIAGYAFKGIASIYNIYSEQTDLRSWQTLPAQIRLTRLILKPGTYQLTLTNFNDDNDPIETQGLGEVTLQAGEVKFIITRTVR